jgi:cation:H+ antiporter
VGVVFLVVLLVYVLVSWSVARKDTTEDTKEETRIMNTPAWGMIMLILIGLVGLPLGSRLLLDAGISLGEELNASETIIGLTVLAFGSSLPELGACIAAAVRKQSDVAMGNVLGSNIFNILGAGGVVALLEPRTVLSPEFTAFSNWAMAAAAVLAVLVVFSQRRVGILTGFVFLVCYALYLAGLYNNWSLDGVGDLIVAPAAQRPV